MRLGGVWVVLIVCGLCLPGGVATAGDFSFAVIGHARGERDGQPYQFLDRLLVELESLEPDLVVLTGDLIFGDYLEAQVDRDRITAHWERFDAALARLEVPVLRVPGNHDINDPVTRDIWLERYGEPGQAVTFNGSRFVLLSTPTIPIGDDPPALPRPDSRVEDLPAPQLAFLRAELEQADAFDHVFLFVHHVLWWESDRAWWTEVHPLLVENGVRAVFAGDYGPVKFSHVRRDGIDYFQSALEWVAPVPALRYYEAARLMNFQFDNFLFVTVHGPDVEFSVETHAVLESGKNTPDRWHKVFPDGEGSAVRSEAKPKPSRRRLAGMLAASFVTGAVLCWIGLRLRR